MKKNQPINKEADFGINELFFSRTDTRGIITAGNSVFYRVSGYAPENLIGKPHNIIRHPDMPKAVFQYFWETVQAGQPIVAYVKNMAIDGSFYWVLAVAFPADDGYISIRIKPTSSVFSVVKTLYADLLSVEKQDGVKASYKLLFEKLHALGFKSYSDFSRHALAEEMASRDRQRKRSRVQGMARVFEDAITKYASVFETTNRVTKISAATQSTVNEILGSYRDVRFAAVNMTLEAERGGPQGRVLATIATTFETWASDVSQAMQTVQTSAIRMNERFDGMTLAVMMARFQCDMLLFLASEFEHDPEAARRETEPFFRMAGEVFANVLVDVSHVLEDIRALNGRLETLRETLNALAVIQQSSRVETARLDDCDSFGKHIGSMSTFIASVNRAASSLYASVGELREGVDRIHTTIEGVRDTISKCATK